MFYLSIYPPSLDRTQQQHPPSYLSIYMYYVSFYLSTYLSIYLSIYLSTYQSIIRKNQRALKLATLTLLDTLVKNYSAAISVDMLSPVLAELPPLVNEADLHIAQESDL